MADKIIETGGSQADPTEFTIRVNRSYIAKRYCALLLVVLSLFSILLVAGSAFSQTLDNAVSRQLSFGPSLIRPCFELLGEDAAAVDEVLVGPLFDICTRFAPSPGAGPSESAGGGAATPNTLPSILQQRLREARGEEKEPAPSGASADAVGEYASGLGLFFSVSAGDLDRDLTKFEDVYDSDIWRVTAGADYQFNSNFLAGFAIDYYQHDGDYDSGGDFDNDSLGILAYGSFLPVDDLFFQVYGGLSYTDYDRKRFAALADTDFLFGDKDIIPVASGVVKGSYDGNNFRAGALAGYFYTIQNFTVVPRLGIDWIRREFDSYSEKGDTGLELQFDDDDQKHLQSRVGLLASVAFMTRFGAVVPQASFDWKHEFEDDQRDIDVSFWASRRPSR